MREVLEFRGHSDVHRSTITVIISNGAAKNDIRISQMSPAQLKNVMDLLEQRKHRRMIIGWIEENHGAPAYQ